MRFDLADDFFPALTTNKLHLKSIIHELLWSANGVCIWDEWVDENGDLASSYGSQWHSWPTPDTQHIDQREPDGI